MIRTLLTFVVVVFIDLQLLLNFAKDFNLEFSGQKSSSKIIAMKMHFFVVVVVEYKADNNRILKPCQ